MKPARSGNSSCYSAMHWFCPRRQSINRLEPAPWLVNSYFRDFLTSFPIRSFTQEERVDILTKAIAFAYLCAEEDVPGRRVTTFSDNIEETQFNVPILQTILVTLDIDSTLIVRCKPIRGTDVSFGMVQKSEFYSRKLKGGTYGDLVIGILDWYVKLAEDDPNKQLLTNHVLQLHEACFNCIGRHKEVLEYLIQDTMLAMQPTLDISRPNSGNGLFITLFRRFLDRMKIMVLDLTIINPLKYIFRDKYSVYENLDNHGRSFWSAIAERTGIAMPYDDIQDVDTGWSWGAYNFWNSLPPEAQIIYTDPNNIGKNWTDLCKNLPPLTGYPPFFGSFYGVTLSQFMLLIPRSQAAPYERRFSELLSTGNVLHRFCLFLVQLPEWKEVEQFFGTIKQEDLVDPDTAETQPETVRRMLRQCGIDLK